MHKWAGRLHNCNSSVAVAPLEDIGVHKWLPRLYINKEKRDKNYVEIVKTVYNYLLVLWQLV